LVAEVDERRLVQPKGSGSSPLAHPRERVAAHPRERMAAPPRERMTAQRVKARRKPGRGGESHEHASSDTGGGLLEIPRVLRESAVRDRGREHSAMEGVLVRRRPPSLTRRRRKAGLAIRSDGDTGRKARVRGGSRQRASEAASQARRAVENTAAGWLSTEGSAIVTPPGPCCAPHVGVRDKLPQRAPSGAPPGLTRRLRRRPKQEVRRQAKLHLVGSSGRRHKTGAGFPGLAAVGSTPKGESAFVSAGREARGAPRATARWGVAAGAARNRAVRRVLVTGVGCRSR
jgi:hypothetical protein